MTQALQTPGADPVAPEPEAFELRRLRKRAEFLFAAQGISAARGAVVVQARPRSDGSPAVGVGFTATKKVGGAVVRNRAKRRMREAARALLPLHAQAGCDYVLVARMGTAERPWPRFLDDVRSALICLAAGGDGPRPPRSRPPRPSVKPRPQPPAKGLSPQG